MIDVVEIMKHWYAGRNLSEIAHGLGLDRKTVRKYVAAPEREGLVPGVRGTFIPIHAANQDKCTLTVG